MALLFAPQQPTWAQTVTEGAVVRAQAVGFYADERGETYEAFSEVVSFTIRPVSVLAVSPVETAPSGVIAPNQSAAGLFFVTNLGNLSERFNLRSLTASEGGEIVDAFFDLDATGTITPADESAFAGSSTSPNIEPGARLGVIVRFRARATAASGQLRIALTVTSARADAVDFDRISEGSIIRQIGEGALLTSPEDERLPPYTLVDGVARRYLTGNESKGARFTVTTRLRNRGDLAADAVFYRQSLPAGFSLVSGSVKINGSAPAEQVQSQAGGQQALSAKAEAAGATVEIAIGRIEPGKTVELTFEVAIDVSLVERGQASSMSGLLTGLNFPSIASSQALVIFNPFGIVFAGRSSSAAGTPAESMVAVPGAQLTLLNAENSTTPLVLAQGQGEERPNGDNQNPFTTAVDGRFSFRLPDDVAARAGQYLLRIEAPGYRSRLLKLTTEPSQSGLFNLRVEALDNQPLGADGGTLLKNGTVLTRDSLALIAFDMPMFEARALEVEISADREAAQIGDTVSYVVTATNHTSLNLSAVAIDDLLPEGFIYAANTLRMEKANGLVQVGLQPSLDGQRMRVQLGNLSAGEAVSLKYRVRISPKARSGWQENAARAVGSFPDSNETSSVWASARVRVTTGVFSSKQILLGRVFIDLDNNQRFTQKDEAVKGARVYLASGQFAVTDERGLYNFPAIPEGVVFVALDRESLPEGLKISNSGHRAGNGWSRMLRAPIGGGALFSEDFALVRQAASAGDGAAAILETALTASSPETTLSGLPGTPASSVFKLEEGEIYFPAFVEGADPVITSSSLVAQVRLGWKVRLEINGVEVTDKQIGETREDRAKRLTTYTYYGLNLRAGENSLRATSVSTSGQAGRTLELKVWGPGPIVRLEILPERGEIEAGGRERVNVEIRAVDAWGHASADEPVMLEVTGAEIIREGDAESANQSEVMTSRRVNGLEAVVGSTQPHQPQNGSERERIILALRGGRARIQLRAPGSSGQAHLTASTGKIKAEYELAIVTAKRDGALVVGGGSITIGSKGRADDGGSLGKQLAFFYRGNLGRRNVLTLAYDSRRSINRSTGRAGDGSLFGLDPDERRYPLFGDDSVRYEDASSNSHLYARLDRGRSHLMFGDMTTGLEGLRLAGYSRKLTGVKLHLENAAGDQVTVTGARPNTDFAREVFDGGLLSTLRLRYIDIVPGSETLTLEVRDRRRPELLLSTDVLLRGVDYQLETETGRIYLLRYVPAFDSVLNLVRLTIVYEHYSQGLGSRVITLRAKKQFSGLGLTLGLAAIEERRSEGAFHLYGLDGEQRLPNGGIVRFAVASSAGSLSRDSASFWSAEERAATGTLATGDAGAGYAADFQWEQPLSFWQGKFQLRGSWSTQHFGNPFGATVVPGRMMGEATITLKPKSHSEVRLGALVERNRAGTLDNHRETLSTAWTEQLRENLQITLGFDHRRLTDDRAGKVINSNLVTIGADWRPIRKLQLTIKREQNLGESDPTYPTQTTIGARYELSSWTNLFFTSRISRAPIVPISAITEAGLSFSSSRSEWTAGIETRLASWSSLTGRYMSQSGAGGRDSFAVIGLSNRWHLSEELSLEAGMEYGQHLSGPGKSFQSVNVGAAWRPREDFETAFRYEVRRKEATEHLLTVSASGRLSESLTALARGQWGRTGIYGDTGFAGMLAVALRPANSDRMGLLLAYDWRRLQSANSGEATATPESAGRKREMAQGLSMDGYYRLSSRLEFSGRLGGRFVDDGQAGARVRTLTLLGQGRLQYRFSERFDAAGELRETFQSGSRSERRSAAFELGYWPTTAIRLGLGYRFEAGGDPSRISPSGGGFYFNASGRLSELFDLFRPSGKQSGENGDDGGRARH